MQISFVTPFYYPELKFGGPPKRLHGMARALAASSQKVIVITLDSRQRTRDESVVCDGIRVQYLPWTGKGLYAFPTNTALLRNALGEADVVHCFGLYNFICPLATFFAKAGTKPSVLEPMGMFVARNRSFVTKAMYNQTATRWMAKNAAAIVATSELEATELMPLTRFAPVVVRPNGIDVSEFAELPLREIMRTCWNVQSDERLVLYLGRISAKKRLVELVEAFELARLAKTRLVIAGPVSEEAYLALLRRRVSAAQVSESITIAPPVYGNDLRAALSAADLFVMPSENENFGNAAGEAVAAGVPVLLTETCGIAPLIHGRAGYAVPLGVESLADGLRKMLDPEFRERMTARREEVKRELSWDEPVAQTIALYQRIIAQSRR